MITWDSAVLPQNTARIESVWQLVRAPGEIRSEQRSNRDLQKLLLSSPDGKLKASETSTFPGALEYYLQRQTLGFPPHLLPDSADDETSILDKVSTVLYKPSPDSGGSAGWAVFVPHYDDHPTPDHQPTAPVLDIIDCHVPDSATFQEDCIDLLCQLHAQAQRYGCQKIESWEWDVDKAILDVWRRQRGFEILDVTRTEHLGAVAWYGKEPAERIEMVS